MSSSKFPLTPALPTRIARRVQYAWIVAGLIFMALLVAAGIRSTPGVLIVPLEEAFGWSRATVSTAVSINIVLYGLMGPFAAAAMQRFGVRRTLLAALALLGTACILTTFISEPWHLMLSWGVLVGLGSGTVALVLAATIVNRWFVERRGLVMGVLTASTATGQLVFLPLLASVVTAYGWQSVAWVMAAVIVAVIPLVFVFLPERPRDVGLLPYGAKDASAVPTEAVAGNPVVNALSALSMASKSRDFWLLFASFFVCGLSTNGLIGTHLISACIDNGIPEVQAAGLLAAMGIFDLIGTTASGWLSDRYDSRVLLFCYYFFRGLSLLYLPYSEYSFYGLSMFSVFYGLDWIATVPPTVRLTTEAFGKQRAPIVFGWIVAGHQLGGGMAASGAGVLRTMFGSYLEAFLIAGFACAIAAMMSLMIGRGRARTVAP
ncbi:MAG TPA: MFS transporter [Alphaproteobacteria bacterium]|jgi:MFS family permease|nr:MFS transporter [Alphaproteobacteria bacterium]